MKTYEEILEHARAWLRMVEPMRSPELGLLHAKAAHTGGRGTPEGLGRYHSTAMDGAYYVLCLLACGERLEEARRGLATILDNQDLDPESETYGSFRWYVEDERVADGNGTFFTVQSLLIIFLFYKELLSEDLVARLEAAFRLSLDRKFLCHCPRVGYTNAFVGDNVLAAILAELFDDTEALAIVRANFERFYQFNFEDGIIERLSPCYYGTTLPLAALAVGRVRDPRIRSIARELMDTLLLESEFFGGRTPLPANRTYSGNGEARNFLFLAWPLGLNPMSVEQLAERGWLHGSTVAIWHELASAGLETRDSSSLPAPRILEGRFTKEGALYSCYHPDFTLGSFSLYPELGGEIQDAYDMAAGFSGDGNNLGLLGYVFEHPDGSQTGVPLRSEMGDTETGFRQLRTSAGIEFRNVSHQHENVLIWLAHLDHVNMSLRSLGTTLRIPQFTGQAYDSEGNLLEGNGGRLEPGWVFFITENARFGILPLQRTLLGQPSPALGSAVWYCLPSDPSQVRPYPGPWHPHPEPSTISAFAEPNQRFGLSFPNFEAEGATALQRRSVVGGAVVVAEGRDVEPAQFMDNCRAWQVKERWSHDGYLQRRDAAEAVREVELASPGVSMRLVYDNQLKRVIERTVNGVASIQPSARSHVRRIS